MDGFTACLIALGAETRAYRLHRIFQAEALILHWPDALIVPAGPRAWLMRPLRLLWLRQARHRGMRIIWIAHNLQPHDHARPRPRHLRAFLSGLDGIIHLSETARAELSRDFPLPPSLGHLVLPHPHYRDSAVRVAPPRQPPAEGEALTLLQFGKIRAYKNCPALIRAFGSLGDPNLRLHIAGAPACSRLAREILRAGDRDPRIRTDLRRLSEPELETMIDSAGGIVLPYQTILNSGAALMALSRNRPVLAPRLGSLSELQREVGQGWLQLYDGPLTSEILARFTEFLRGDAATGICPLDQRGWHETGRTLAGFLEELGLELRRT